MRRLREKEPELAQFRPETISIKDLRGRIETRQDFNRELNKLARFSRRGSEDIRTTDQGVITTDWQFHEAAIMQRVVTTKRRKKREEVKSWQQQESESLFDKPRPAEVTPRSWDQYIKSLEREVLAKYDENRKKLYLENYIQSVKQELGFQGREIIAFVDSLDLDTFVKNSLTNPMLRIEFVYTEAAKKEVAEAILSEWRRVT